MTDKQKNDIEWYERHLEKVKLMHNPIKSNRPDLCKMYIKHATDMLEAVKDGRSPFAISINQSLT